MNNKLTISVLVVLIVIIWGTIAFRIKSYTPVKSTILPVSESLEMDTVLHVEKLYTLRGDYPDPFLGGHEKKSSLGLVVVKEKRKITIRAISQISAVDRMSTIPSYVKTLS